MKMSQWDKFLYDLENHPYLRKTIQVWYWNSKEETNSFNKFIYAWIAFEAFASSYTEEKLPSEVKDSLKNDKKVNNYFSSLMKDQSFSKNVLDLQRSYYVWDTNIKYSKDLKIKKKIEISQDFDDVLDILYNVKYSLFKDGKKLNIERDRKISLLSFKVIYKLLEKIFSEASF
jgi:hypothetical protein